MPNSQTREPRKTRRWVLIADRIADKVITVGGVSVIAAVLGMLVFLVWEVLPLFRGGTVVSHSDYRLQGEHGPLLGINIDEHNTAVVTVAADGEVRVWHAGTGTPLAPRSFDFSGKTVTAFSKAIDGTHVAFGFSDGTVRFGKIDFDIQVLRREQLPTGLTEIDGRDSTDGRSVFSIIPGDQIRKTDVKLDLSDEVLVSDSGSAIEVMDYRVGEFGERPRSTLATVDAKAAPSLSVGESKLNFMTGKATTTVAKTALPQLPDGIPVKYALVNDVGDQLFFADKNGRVYRFGMGSSDKPILAETVDLLPAGVELTAFGYLLGDRSLVVGGSDGSVSIYFLLRRDKAASADGFALVQARKFEPHEAAVTAFTPSQRSKTFATADAKGNVWVRHGTSQKTVIRVASSDRSAGRTILALNPRVDGLLALTENGTGDFWRLNIEHPETSLHTLFGKVWYEGYDAPSYTWQSTGATDAFEPKISLVPLIFGTLKATFYSLLFAIPIALLAAIYTSEFLPVWLKGKVKPFMEVMASIPSVVLGFVAALVLAPVVETWMGAVILAFVLLPLIVIGAAYLWQTLPPPIGLRLEGFPKLLAILGTVCLSLYAAYRLGPSFEKLFFGGNFRTWLTGESGSATPFLFLVTLPVMCALVAFAASRLYGVRFNRHLKTLRMPHSALLDMARWLGIIVASAILSYVLAAILSQLGMDPRGSLVDTYVQRNTLVVGFAMGFAVIPLIYTLSEDALSAVPEHLRSASLGCGATLWQTAIWIILPTAISGVFSAIMIGMGRAVGETMIVVMAAGNTPLMDMNIFNGLRALSANIAVELPEAPKDGSLYRVLFLTGLVLFAMTFTINTVAEVVRIHFRKRAMQL